MKKRTLGLLAAATALAMGGRASAAIITVTYTGAVSSGYDQTGLFGPAGSDLTGDSYVATYTINTAYGSRTDDLPMSDEISGGSFYGDSSPVSATIEVNGITQSIGGTFQGGARVAPPQQFMTDFAVDTSDDGNVYNYVQNFSQGITGANVYESLPLGVTSINGGVVFSTFDPDTNQNTVYTFANVHGLGMVQISGIPEPATWAMMLLGVGGIGAALRIARKQAMATA